MRTQQNQWGFLTIGLVVWALSGCAETIESSEGETKNPVPTLSLPDPSGKYALSPEEDSLVEQSDTSTPPLVIEWDGYAGEDNGESSVAPHEGSNPPQHESEGEDGDETLPSFPMPLSLGEAFVDISGPIVHAPLMEIEHGDDPHQKLPDRTHGLFADLDGDGRAEVIIDGTSCCKGQEKSGPLPYRFSEETGEMEFAPDLMDVFPSSIQGSVLGWVDLNGDGYQDILTSYGAQLFFLRDPDTGGWKDPYQLHHPALGQPYLTNGAVAVADLDQNGLLDVLVGDGLCDEGTELVMGVLQVTPGHFVPKGSLFDPGMPSGDPYAVWAGPAGPPGEYIIGAFGRSCDPTNPHSAFLKRVGWNADGYPVFEQFDPTPLDSAYKEHALQAFGPISQVNPMGATFGDMSLDGLIDTAITYSTPQTTYWTRHGIPSQARFGVFQANLDWPFIDRTIWSNVGPPAGISTYNMIPWGIALVDVNRDGMGDLIAVHGPDASGLLEPSHWVGPQHTTLSLATSLLHFEDATAMSGLDVDGHWRALTIGDLDGDGDVDLIVGGLGEHPRVFENRIETEGKGLSIRLVGQFSNAAGLGAFVSVDSKLEAAGRRHLVGHVSSPEAISDPLVFPAIGSETHSGVVTVRWPSGYIQKTSGLQAGKLHTIEEPELVVFEPASRSHSFNAPTPLWVAVTPRDPYGAVDPDATVSVTASDPKVLVGSPVIEDGVWRFPLEAPGAPGSSTLEIQIDGEAYGIRPRVRWTVE